MKREKNVAEKLSKQASEQANDMKNQLESILMYNKNNTGLVLIVRQIIMIEKMPSILRHWFGLVSFFSRKVKAISDFDDETKKKLNYAIETPLYATDVYYFMLACIK